MISWFFMNQKIEKRQRVLNRRYDLTGNSIFRVFRYQLLAKFIPMGNYRGGPGLKCMLVLGVVHYFGKPLFGLLARYERQAQVLYKFRERVRNK